MSQNENYLDELLNSMSSENSEKDDLVADDSTQDLKIESLEVEEQDSLMDDLLMDELIFDNDDKEEIVEDEIAVDERALEEMVQEEVEEKEVSLEDEVSELLGNFEADFNVNSDDVVEEINDEEALDTEVIEEEVQEDEMTAAENETVADSDNVEQDLPDTNDVYGFNYKDIEDLDLEGNDRITDDFFDNFMNSELGMSENEVEDLLSKASVVEENEETLEEIVKNHNDDLDAINELLRRVDKSDNDDVDILALLKSDENFMEQAKASFEEKEAGSIEEEPVNTKEKKTKVKKEKVKRKSRRRKGKDTEEEEVSDSGENERSEEVTYSEENELALDNLDIGKELVTENEKKVKGKKVKKEKVKKEKKPSLWSKLVEFAMSDDEDDNGNVDKSSDEDEKNELSEFDQLASNSEENTEVLKQLDEETPKKGKKEKKKKEPKEKKPPKEKKEKKEKEKADPLFGPHLPLMRVIRIALIFAMIAALFIIVCVFYSDYKITKDATKAYYNNNYTEAYKLLYGKELSGSEELIFRKANLLSTMERRYDSYEAYLLMKKEVEALHSLLEAITTYDEVYGTAQELDITTELDELYAVIQKELLEKYNLSEEEAKEIVGTEDSKSYTEKIYEILDIETDVEVDDVIEDKLENVLDKEEELEDFDFIS